MIVSAQFLIVILLGHILINTFSKEVSFIRIKLILADIGVQITLQIRIEVFVNLMIILSATGLK